MQVQLIAIITFLAVLLSPSISDAKDARLLLSTKNSYKGCSISYDSAFRHSVTSWGDMTIKIIIKDDSSVKVYIGGTEFKGISIPKEDKISILFTDKSGCIMITAFMNEDLGYISLHTSDKDGTQATTIPCKVLSFDY